MRVFLAMERTRGIELSITKMFSKILFKRVHKTFSVRQGYDAARFHLAQGFVDLLERNFTVPMPAGEYGVANRALVFLIYMRQMNAPHNVPHLLGGERVLNPGIFYRRAK